MPTVTEDSLREHRDGLRARAARPTGTFVLEAGRSAGDRRVRAELSLS
jgi:hypothetical protein